MVEPLAIGLLALVLLVLLGTYRIVKAVRPLVVNAVVGLVVLLLAGALGFGVEITPVVVLIVAFGGLPAAVLVIILAQLGLLFTPAVLGFVGSPGLDRLGSEAPKERDSESRHNRE